MPRQEKEIEMNMRREMKPNGIRAVTNGRLMFSTSTLLGNHKRTSLTHLLVRLVTFDGSTRFDLI